MLLILRPFRVGDGIQVAGQSGTVGEIALFTTIIISDDLAYLSIPNASIFGGVIVNNSREPIRRVNFIVSIDFANEIDVTQKIVSHVLNYDPRVLKESQPMTGAAALHEYAIDIVVRCWVRNAESEAALIAFKRRSRTGSTPRGSPSRLAAKPRPHAPTWKPCPPPPPPGRIEALAKYNTRCRRGRAFQREGRNPARVSSAARKVQTEAHLCAYQAMPPESRCRATCPRAIRQLRCATLSPVAIR
jgi:hypothetical protein